MNNSQESVSDSFETRFPGVTITLLIGDVCTLGVDAVVTPAVMDLVGGGIVDKLIHKVAGPKLLAATQALPYETKYVSEKWPEVDVRCDRGSAVLTKGPFAEEFKPLHVIHTVGPDVNGTRTVQEESVILGRCLTKCFQIALNEKFTSIAFTAVSCGVKNNIGAEWVKGAAECNIVTCLEVLERYKERGISLENILFVFKDMDLYNAWKVAAHDKLP